MVQDALQDPSGILSLESSLSGELSEERVTDLSPVSHQELTLDLPTVMPPEETPHLPHASSHIPSADSTQVTSSEAEEAADQGSTLHPTFYESQIKYYVHFLSEYIATFV